MLWFQFFCLIIDSIAAFDEAVAQVAVVKPLQSFSFCDSSIVRINPMSV